MRKWTKMLFCALAFVFSAHAFVGCNDNKSFEKNFVILEYKDDVQMMIGGFTAPFHRFMDEGEAWGKAFTECAEIGLTLLIPDSFQMDFESDPTRAMELMDHAYNAGLKVLVQDRSLGVPHLGRDVIDNDKWNTAQAAEYTRHPAFYGLHFMDEPWRDKFEPLAAKAKKWKAEFPDKKLVTTLLPSYAGETMLGGTFRDYVNDFIDIAQPEILQFDFYPFREGAEKYFQDHALIRQTAKDAGIPAAAFVLTSGHAAYKRNLSAADLRWEMAVLMAFGFSSISHYAIDPPYNGYDRFYSDDGERNELWYNVQTVNREVLKWDHVYLRFADGWKGTAALVAPGGVNNMIDGIDDGIKDGRIEPDEIDGIESISTTGDILLGVFEDANKNKGFMLTNAAKPDREINLWTEVQFSSEYKGALIYERGEPKVIELDKDGKAVISLEFGEGKFIIPLKGR